MFIFSFKRINKNYYLRFFNGRSLSITHGTDVQSLLPLLITLLEELLRDAVAPLAVEEERLRRTRQVRAVHHVL